MQSWVQQPPAPAPPSGRSGSRAPALVDNYQMFDDDDPEEYQALDRLGGLPLSTMSIIPLCVGGGLQGSERLINYFAICLSSS